MKKLLLICLLCLPLFAQEFTYTCDNQGVCTQTTTTVESLKTGGTSVSSAVKSNVGGGAGFGNVQTNNATCDQNGNCTAGTTSTFTSNQLLGNITTETSGTLSEGITGSYQSQFTKTFKCNYSRNYTMSSGHTIRVEDCVEDSSRNIIELKARVCEKALARDTSQTSQQGNYSVNKVGCDENNPAHWGNTEVFSSTTLPYINGITRPLSTDVVVTISCQPMSPNCSMDITATVELSGTPNELGKKAADMSTDPDNFFSGQQMGNRISNDPSFNTMLATKGTDMADCAKNNLFGDVNNGFLMSCDGATVVNMDAQCTEVVTCVTLETTVITNALQCESNAPIASQTCEITMPTGQCSVFLENHEQTCDTITPAGECIVELNNTIKSCETLTPSGSCDVALETDIVECVFAVPFGNCDVEELYDTVTCEENIPIGICEGSTGNIVKTCEEDMNQVQSCFVSIPSETSECIATPNYDVVLCEFEKPMRDETCSISYEATISTGPQNCTFANGYTPITGHRNERDYQGNQQNTEIMGQFSRIGITAYESGNAGANCRAIDPLMGFGCSASGSGAVWVGEERQDSCDFNPMLATQSEEIGTLLEIDPTQNGTGTIAGMEWEVICNGDDCELWGNTAGLAYEKITIWSINNDFLGGGGATIPSSGGDLAEECIPGTCITAEWVDSGSGNIYAQCAVDTTTASGRIITMTVYKAPNATSGGAMFNSSVDMNFNQQSTTSSGALQYDENTTYTVKCRQSGRGLESEAISTITTAYVEPPVGAVQWNVTDTCAAL